MEILYERFNKKTTLIAVFFCCIFVTAFLIFYHVPKRQNILRNEFEYQQFKKSQDNIFTYKNKYGNLDDYLEKLEERYQLANISLPNRMQQGEFIKFLQRTAGENQVKIVSLNPNQIQPLIEENKNNIADEVEVDDEIEIMKNVTKLPINLQIECGYVDLINFLKAIEVSERMIDIKNLSIINKNDGEKLNCELNIIIFALEN